MRNGLPVLLSIVLAAMHLGCSHPSAITTYDYHHRYDRMSDRFDPPVSLVYVDPGADLAIYRVMVVGEFDAGEGRVSDVETASRYAGVFFRQVLARELHETGDFYVSLDPDYRSEFPTAVIEGRITVFRTGWGIGRHLGFYFFPLQPAVATDLQVEGRIRDVRSGQVVMEFADRRRFMGNTPWGPTFKTLNAEWAMKQTCILTAVSLVELLGQLREDGG